MGRILVRLDLLSSLRGILWVSHRHINGWIVHRTLLQSGSRPLCYSQATYSTKQLFWSIHEPNRIVELWLSKHKSLLWACIRKSFILDRAYDPFYKIEYFEQTISNMTLYKCSSVWSCIVISISTQQYTSSLHQYHHIGHYLVTVRLYRTPGSWVGSICVARKIFSFLSYADCRNNFES